MIPGLSIFGSLMGNTFLAFSFSYLINYYIVISSQAIGVKPPRGILLYGPPELEKP